MTVLRNRDSNLWKKLYPEFLHKFLKQPWIMCAVNYITEIVTIFRNDLFCRCSLRTLKTEGHFPFSFAQSFIRFYGKRAVVVMASCSILFSYKNTRNFCGSQSPFQVPSFLFRKGRNSATCTHKCRTNICLSGKNFGICKRKFTYHR
jgi:hypothetical protein